ncbi:MAG: hypothetical protein COW21_02565 [Candidatus Aenigmarchaeota archaeon CG15_BIG_FIL_POST_REV_8_21_14_020_37_27]|nr:MAG: hypothetical protein AUJ50_00335 [Candidatus Aenigmarchaeota archaeon CG1_02_38_14]PIV68710.1 MAG: hypothetical protein COS07_03230 [Candidatus Aenigmarchaeota archaeon CG01_land_8_20_14_3_00_37_9]PIW41314.1 MAG: hypothetical protein COW21_02565 [Candidatus Aenigmarchaeota archaeon CG15_BIG_FIL_POST_REV_8_21_14_020_37_27]
MGFVYTENDPKTIPFGDNEDVAFQAVVSVVNLAGDYYNVVFDPAGIDKCAQKVRKDVLARTGVRPFSPFDQYQYLKFEVPGIGWQQLEFTSIKNQTPYRRA